MTLGSKILWRLHTGIRQPCNAMRCDVCGEQAGSEQRRRESKAERE